VHFNDLTLVLIVSRYPVHRFFILQFRRDDLVARVTFQVSIPNKLPSNQQIRLQSEVMHALHAATTAPSMNQRCTNFMLQ
jgi:hypothetical protein